MEGYAMVLTLLIIVIALIFFLVAFLLVRTMLYTRASVAKLKVERPVLELTAPEIDPMETARHLSEALQVKTISH
jgi:uncharacterized protein YqfA (UPF0365 family)